MKVIIACGGTGGHLFPGLAVAETLLARRHQVRLLVSEKGVDQQALASWPACAGSERCSIRAIGAVGLNGSSRWISVWYRLARATRECAAIQADFAADAVVGMGGFTSAPALLAARWPGWRGTPTLIHESNAVPGRVNRWVGRGVDQVAVGLADCARFFDGHRVTVTGTPIRAALQGGRKVADAAARLGLEPGKLTVLVMGGSQGANAINEAIACTLPWLDEWQPRLQFVHLSGAADEEFVRRAYATNGFAATVLGFCPRMELAYSAADLVIARAGAATLTEISAFGLPAILVPYPQAAGNHQWHNARMFVRAGAATLLEQTQLTTGLHAARGERLAEALGALLADEAVRQRMAAAARSLAVTDAAERIAILVEQLDGCRQHHGRHN